jgi:uncharacterized protein (TIGR02145 family)
MKEYGFVTHGEQIYKTVVIGTQTWMAENLNYTGSVISYCGEGRIVRNYNTTTCDTYGRLYNWLTAKTVCPTGWHLPSDAEWDVLITTVDGANTAGTKLKAKSGWSYNDASGDGTDEYGFSALPGGTGEIISGSFFSVGYIGYWWSDTGVYSNSGAYHRYMDSRNSDVDRDISTTNNTLHSVRCVKD